MLKSDPIRVIERVINGPPLPMVSLLAKYLASIQAKLDCPKETHSYPLVRKYTLQDGRTKLRNTLIVGNW